MSPLEKLKKELNNNRGARVGQTAVVSRKVHTIDVYCPQIVNVITNSDAGKSFYNRFNPNEVIHIDLFHEVVACDVNRLASFLKVSLYQSRYSELIDYIDIQTGSGGGRLSGSLDYGTTESLKKDHMNHVHLTSLVSDSLLEVVFFLVDKLEQGLKDQNIEIRRIEKITHITGNAPMDMSPYSSNSDSFLKQNSNGENKVKRDAEELIERCESIHAVRQILEYIKNYCSQGDTLNALKKQNPEMDEILKILQSKNLINRHSNRYSLTPRGELLEKFIKKNYKELELVLKKSLKKVPNVTNIKGIKSVNNFKEQINVQFGPITSHPLSSGERLDEIDVSETCKNAIVRNYHEKMPFRIKVQDIYGTKRKPKIDQDICLIIDASASMSGYRLKNAKYLAKHLILNAKRRLSVLTFQEKDVKAVVPFTKDFALLDSGLNEIVSSGLTPLALALHKSLSYMKTKQLNNPLIILITDGIPTVSLWSSDPIQDAVTAAKELANKKIDFCCIGLQPNKDCLVKITKAARGKLFVVEELNRDSLIEATISSGQIL